MRFTHIPSFVRRAGRLNDKQKFALENLLTEYQTPSLDQNWDLQKIFLNNNEVVVEVGFGMGSSLLQMALENPNTNYIGIEVHKPGIANLVLQLKSNNINNVRIAENDAVLIFQKAFADNSLQGVQIFFPDPWPKARHNKRRLIQQDWIEQIVCKIKPEGFVHCATDDNSYAVQILEVLSKQTKLKNLDLNNGFIARPDSRPVTKFERRAKILGNDIFDLMFTRLA